MEELFSSAKNYTDELYKQLSRVGKSLSSDKRLEILNLLSQGPKTVEKIAKDSGMSVANVSRHLQILNDSRLVKFTKKGTYAFYTLADPSVADFLFALWKIGETQLSEINRIKDDFLGGLGDFYTLTMDEVYEKMSNGNITLIDLRPKDEYEAAHIEGAVSIPMEDLDSYLQELPREKEVIAYCRGKFCAFSAIAAQKLKDQGFTAYRMAESILEWQKYLDQKN
ncbi:ArsR family transcriptional regulator [Cytobacillus firmus]|uniref:ArsR family transcriptional regulator n=2 Tax=Cytobacillus TaxID=2675230 RepID=A0A366JLT3_CYTFI|nr:MULTISPECIES: metalloregulator ArsR/SmtB family transcription factor [Cytobacillus]RBP88685.1 ArsR family transcriptional regulator [Cytobacillus firmus]TDX39470.1 ArsR family transcriptional regulator [Cytobacillus oceanisediminis]